MKVFRFSMENLKFKDIAICAPKDIHPFLESELNNRLWKWI